MSFANTIEDEVSYISNTAVSIEEIIETGDAVQDFNMSLEEINNEINVVTNGLNTLNLLDETISSEDISDTTSVDAVKIALATNDMIYSVLGYNHKANNVSVESIESNPSRTLSIAQEGIGESIKDAMKAILDWFANIFKKIKGLFSKCEKVVEVKKVSFEKLEKEYEGLSTDLKDPSAKITSEIVYNFTNKFAGTLLQLSEGKSVLDYVEDTDFYTMIDMGMSLMLAHFEKPVLLDKIKDSIEFKNTKSIDLSNDKVSKDYLDGLKNGTSLQSSGLEYYSFTPFTFFGKSVKVFFDTRKSEAGPATHNYRIPSFGVHSDTIKDDQLPEDETDVDTKRVPGHNNIKSIIDTAFLIINNTRDCIKKSDNLLKEANDAVKKPDKLLSMHTSITDDADKKKEEVFLNKHRKDIATSMLNAITTFTTTYTDERVTVINDLGWLVKTIMSYYKPKD